jgi:matrix metalloproteinase-14 (membrane-inserted)
MLQVWSMVANINFRRVFSGSVDIDIAFVPQVHGDGYDFDGSGGTLAHAFYPVYGGDVHMDEAERWTIGTYEGELCAPSKIQ